MFEGISLMKNLSGLNVQFYPEKYSNNPPKN